jgi:cytochrome c-type biogenesis protein CcmH
MSAFVAFAVLFAIAALLFVLPPMLRAKRQAGGVTREAVNVSVYRDQLRELEADLAAGLLSQERYEEARRELERGVLEDAEHATEAATPAAPRSRYAALVVGVSVPVLAGMLYLVTGTPGALDVERVAAEQSHAMDRQQMEALVERLAQKLRESKEPNAEGWAMLGRSYNSMGRYQDAVAAYKTALENGPPDARLLADYADALAMVQGRTLSGEPEKLIQQALKLDPQNVKALALAGTVAFDKQNYREAVAHWEKILAVVPPDSDTARSVESSIAEARSLGGLKGPSQAAAPAQPAQAPQAQAASTGGSSTGGSSAGRVDGEVRLDPALASRIAPGDTVFIFARPTDGRMPLAILRKTVSELPAKFVLDDAMAMSPQSKLSAFPEVVIAARVSKSGSAVPQSGDLEGASKPVKIGSANTVVVINSVVK